MLSCHTAATDVVRCTSCLRQHDSLLKPSPER